LPIKLPAQKISGSKNKFIHLNKASTNRMLYFFERVNFTDTPTNIVRYNR